MSRLSAKLGVTTYGWTGDGTDLGYAAKQWLRERRPTVFTARDIEVAQQGISELRDETARERQAKETAERQYRSANTRAYEARAETLRAEAQRDQALRERAILLAALGSPDQPDDPNAEATASAHDVFWEWDLTNKRWVPKSNITIAEAAP